MIRFNKAEKVITITGITLFVLSFLSELNFHYIQGFMPEKIDAAIFWKAEAAEVFNSMSFLLMGIILIITSFLLSKKRRKRDL
jgi:LPXTG-motif cell wall-anchored protein